MLPGHASQAWRTTYKVFFLAIRRAYITYQNALREAKTVRADTATPTPSYVSVISRRMTINRF
jgi:hypothetical protein